ncbi:MAG: hypothetical protein F6K48_22010 [Okeania sp. SIO3H1]|nr:hypothetical protein [Okeania sp. SIO3H1]NET24906.1 hypothetical protein [Okeania sp. SIO1I7]
MTKKMGKLSVLLRIFRKIIYFFRTINISLEFSGIFRNKMVVNTIFYLFLINPENFSDDEFIGCRVYYSDFHMSQSHSQNQNLCVVNTIFYLFLINPENFSDDEFIGCRVYYSDFHMSQSHSQNQNLCGEVPWNILTVVYSNKNCCKSIYCLET